MVCCRILELYKPIQSVCLEYSKDTNHSKGIIDIP